MTPVHSVKNQYRGINAHLHSYWQAEGGWDGFHANHITFLTAALKAQLLPMGYTAESQQSLQIRRYGEPAGRPEPDVTVYDPDPFRLRKPYAPPRDMGLPSELILKMPDAAYYRNKRWKILRSGIVFVEMDYLHESPPTFDGIPFYRPTSKQPESDPDSHPYRIVVADPRPAFDDGKVYPHEFDVDREIPIITIPLSGSDALDFDFNAPYRKTYAEMLYGLERVDYSQLPLNFDRYSRDDQVRILARMLFTHLTQNPHPPAPSPSGRRGAKAASVLKSLALRERDLG